MQIQQVNHPKWVSHTVNRAFVGGSRKRLEKAFYLPTVRSDESYRSSDGAPYGGCRKENMNEQGKLFEPRYKLIRYKNPDQNIHPQGQVKATINALQPLRTLGLYKRRSKNDSNKSHNANKLRHDTNGFVRAFVQNPEDKQ